MQLIISISFFYRCAKYNQFWKRSLADQTLLSTAFSRNFTNLSWNCENILSPPDRLSVYRLQYNYLTCFKCPLEETCETTFLLDKKCKYNFFKMLVVFAPLTSDCREKFPGNDSREFPGFFIPDSREWKSRFPGKSGMNLYLVRSGKFA